MKQFIHSNLSQVLSFNSFFLAALLIAMFVPFLKVGFPETHDGENHLVRFANYKLALQQGQVPPRFAPNLFQGYGYPVFNYNYPLANILSLPFSAVDLSYEATFKVLMVVFIIFGLIGANSWLNALKIGRSGRVIVLASWLLNPYLVTNLYIRGNIGEILAYCLLPWMLYIIDCIREQKQPLSRIILLGFLAAGFLLSHNVAAVFFVPIALLYSLARYKNNLQQWLQLASVAFIGALLSVWFWIPALLEMKYVSVGSTELTAEYLGHLLTLNQLLSTIISRGFSELGSVDGLVIGTGILVVLALLLFSVSSLVRIVMNKGRTEISGYWVYFSIVLVLLFFQTTASEAIWHNAEFLKFIQFPWRLGIYVSVFTLPLLAFVWQQKAVFLRILIVIAMTFHFSQTIAHYPPHLFTWTNGEYEQMSISTTTKNENKPVTFEHDLTVTREDRPGRVDGEALASQVHRWNGTARKYELSLSEPTVVVEPTMYFAGWETYVTASDGTTKKVTYVNNNDIKGRIAYELPPGEYTVRSSFTQNTWPRILGNTLSGITFVVLVLLFILNKRKERTNLNMI